MRVRGLQKVLSWLRVLAFLIAFCSAASATPSERQGQGAPKIPARVKREAAQMLEKIRRESLTTFRYLDRLESAPSTLPNQKLPNLREQMEWALNFAARQVAKNDCRDCELSIAAMEDLILRYRAGLGQMSGVDSSLTTGVSHYDRKTATNAIGIALEHFEVKVLGSGGTLTDLLRHDPHARFLNYLVQALIVQTLSNEPMSAYLPLVATIFETPYSEMQCALLRSLKLTEADDVQWLLQKIGDPSYRSIRPCVVGYTLHRLMGVAQVAVAEKIWHASSAADREQLIMHFGFSFERRPFLTDDDELLMNWMASSNSAGLRELVFEQVGKHGTHEMSGVFEQLFRFDDNNPALAEAYALEAVLKLGPFLCEESQDRLLHRVIQKSSVSFLKQIAHNVLLHPKCAANFKAQNAFLRRADVVGISAFVQSVLPEIQDARPTVQMILSKLDLQSVVADHILDAIIRQPRSGEWKDLIWSKLQELQRINPAVAKRLVRQIDTLQPSLKLFKQLNFTETALTATPLEISKFNACENALLKNGK